MELDDSPDNLYLQQCLRLSIIHAQICIREFFKWREADKERKITLAKQMFA